MRQDWLEFAQQMALTPSPDWAGSRKIFRNVEREFTDLKEGPELADVGYSKSKMAGLLKAYIHAPSLDMAVDLWSRRIKATKTGSVGFSCYNHLIKPWSDLTGKRQGSLMGPCLQAVVVTMTPKRTAEVCIFYRTTELFKKFPADLVMLRDHMLARFDFSTVPLEKVGFYFVNVTVSPTYLPVLFPLFDDPLDFLARLRAEDPRFYGTVGLWTCRLMDPAKDPELEKFNQSRRVGRHLKKTIPEKQRQEIVDFLRKHDPSLFSGAIDIEDEDE